MIDTSVNSFILSLPTVERTEYFIIKQLYGCYLGIPLDFNEDSDLDEIYDFEYDEFNNLKGKPKQIRRKFMAIKTNTIAQPKGWVEANLQGFKLSQAGNHIIGNFRLEDGDFASWLINNPVKLADINKLLEALGLAPFTEPSQIVLPEPGDMDMMNMDGPVMVKIKQSKDGKFLNVVDFKPSNAMPGKAGW